MPKILHIASPTWEAAARIHVAMLENPNATPEGHANAKTELIKIGKLLDTVRQENSHGI